MAGSFDVMISLSPTSWRAVGWSDRYPTQLGQEPSGLRRVLRLEASSKKRSLNRGAWHWTARRSRLRRSYLRWAPATQSECGDEARRPLHLRETSESGAAWGDHCGSQYPGRPGGLEGASCLADGHGTNAVMWLTDGTHRTPLLSQS